MSKRAFLFRSITVEEGSCSTNLVYLSCSKTQNSSDFNFSGHSTGYTIKEEQYNTKVKNFKAPLIKWKELCLS